MTEELMTPDDMRKELAQCKEIIDNGIAICFAVGAALERVRDLELYKFDDCVTFQQWTTKHYGWTKQHCGRLILDAKAIASLPESMRDLIQTERAANELSKVPEGLRIATVMEASDGGTKPVTQEAIRRVIPVRPANGGSKKKKSKIPEREDDEEEKPQVTQPTRKEKKKGPVDKSGIEVPPECLELWERGNKDDEHPMRVGTAERTAQEMVKMLAVIKANVKARMDGSDRLFVECDLQLVVSNITQSITELECAIPAYVCWECNGKTPKGCSVCSGPKENKLKIGRGFVSKQYYNLNCPEEIKKLRGGK